MMTPQKTRTAGLLCAASLLQLSAALAADVSWDNPGTGLYTTGTNWSTDTVPTATDNAIIANGGTAQLSTGESASVVQLRVNNGTLTQDGASVTTGITSSSWQTTGDLQVGGSSGQTGALIVSGESTVGSSPTINTGRVRIGGYNTGSNSSDVHGSLTMSGASVLNITPSGYDFWLGNGTGSTGTLTMSGSSQINITQSGGTAGRAGGAATVVQSGTSKFTSQTAYFFGEGGTADWTVKENATLQIGGNIDIGEGNGSNSIMRVQDSATVSSGDQLFIGNGANATATLNIEGGTVSAVSWIALGRDEAKGTLNVSGGSFTKTGTGTHFVTNGNAANVATINHTGGTITNTVSETQLSERAVNVTAWTASAGTGNFGDFQVGRAGSATVTLSGTANYTAATVRLGVNSGSTGVLNLDGGTLTTSSLTEVAGSGTVSFNGGILRAGAGSADFLGGFEDADLSILSGGLKFDTNGNAVTITQALAGVGGLTKLGVGSLTLSGLNTYTGDTMIDAGTLLVTSAYFADFSSIYLTTGSVLGLSTGGATDTVDQLFFNGVAQASGLWGAPGSGAAHESAFFTGDGFLLVTVPEPADFAIGVLALALGISWRRAALRRRGSANP